MFIYSLLVLCATKVSAFYLPEIAPVNYCETKVDGCRNEIPVFVNRLNSRRTILPYEYEKFDFCKAATEEFVPILNLGQVLFGDRIRQNSLYKLKFNQSETCNEVCSKQYQPSDSKLEFLKDAIRKNYYHHWIVDNLPVQWCYRTEDIKFSGVIELGNQPYYCVTGFPVGCYVTKDGIRKDNCLVFPGAQSKNTYYLFNHLHITVHYRQNEDMGGAKIIFVRVLLKSAKNKDDCLYGGDVMMSISGGPLKTTLNISYYYSVSWEEDKTRKWANRWDPILEQLNYSNIQWFSIINSSIVILFMTSAVIVFVVRVLKRDIARSNQLKDSEDSLGKYDKWRLLHGDVFRPPRHGMVLSALSGSGIQVLFTTMITIQFAAFGFFSPANRGALGFCAMVFFTVSGFPAGVASARVFKRFGGERRKTNAVVTALLCPGIVFVMFLIFNITFWSLNSSAAVPVTTILAIAGLWLGISLPLTFAGAFLCYRREEKFPSTPFNEMPRPIPKRSILCKTCPGMVFGGVLPFGCLFIQSFFFLNSIWSHQIYYQPGFQLFVLVLLLITCSESTVLLCYFHLCSQDYHWWWRSFLSGGFCGFYFFVYTVYYYYTKTDLEGATSTFLYFGYMLMAAFVLFLLTGSIGFFACFWFVKKIYSVVK